MRNIFDSKMRCQKMSERQKLSEQSTTVISEVLSFYLFTSTNFFVMSRSIDTFEMINL